MPDVYPDAVSRRPLVIAKPSKPVSQMTDDEREAYARAIAKRMMAAASKR